MALNEIGIRRLLSHVCGALFAAAILMTASFASYYGATAPKHPDPATGRTIPYAYHGPPVYLTKAEDRLVWWPFDAIFLLGGLAGLFHISASDRP